MKKYFAIAVLLCCFLVAPAQHVPFTAQQFNDETFTLWDDGDPTKRVMLELSGLTTNTTRTISFVDFDGFFVIDGTACSDIEGTGLAITASTLNWACPADAIDDNDIDLTDVTLADFTDDVGYLRDNGSVDLIADWTISANSITLTAGTMTAGTGIFGDVGIGTTPQTALHIATNVGSGIKLERGTLDARWWGASGGPAYFGTISNDALNIQTNNNTRMTIAAGGAGGAVDVVGNLTVGGTLGAGAITGTSLTDGTTTIDDGNYTGVGNITGADSDVNLGTGTFITTGTLGTGVATLATNSTIGNISFYDDQWGSQINTSGTQYDFRVGGSTIMTCTATVFRFNNRFGFAQSVVSYPDKPFGFADRTGDRATNDLYMSGQKASTTSTGANRDGGNIYIDGGLHYSTGEDGNLYLVPNRGNVRIGDTTAPTETFEVKADSIRVVDTQTPASNGTGTQGEIAWDPNFIYICTDANTWKRAALTGGY